MRSSVDLPQPDGPTKTHELAVRHLEVDAVDDVDGAEGLVDAAKLLARSCHFIPVPAMPEVM